MVAVPVVVAAWAEMAEMVAWASGAAGARSGWDRHEVQVAVASLDECWEPRY